VGVGWSAALRAKRGPHKLKQLDLHLASKSVTINFCPVTGKTGTRGTFSAILTADGKDELRGVGQLQSGQFTQELAERQHCGGKPTLPQPRFVKMS
jgi:hypothetical protein